ncbi:MAG: hypothetical protein WBA67_02595 [Jannaschia sp.]
MENDAKNRTLFGLKVCAAMLVMTEAASAGAAAINIGSGPVLMGGILASQGALVAYMIWTANAALAILAGLRRRPMMLMALLMAIFGATLGTPLGWAISALGAGALVLILPLLIAEHSEPYDDDESGEVLRFTRFAEYSPRRKSTHETEDGSSPIVSPRRIVPSGSKSRKRPATRGGLT